MKLTNKRMSEKFYVLENLIFNFKHYHFQMGTAVAQWLRCCTKNRKVAVSIPAGVSEFFVDIGPR